ncbi:glutaminase [Corallococcus exercitus]|uniref:glutaminase n=1 Tax=Corallococcus exercitus TaxID=2316736 RepID=UPI001FD45041|nr:glutaminase [Corallococcus exercitus]
MCRHCSQVYLALARVAPRLFGACVVGINGSRHGAEDTWPPFSIMSVSKPFLYALVCQALRPELARRKLGGTGTSLPFDSAMAIDQSPDRMTNPMVNPGALASTSLVPGNSPEARWRFIHKGLSRFAGSQLALDEEVYASARETHHRNQGLAFLLHGLGRLEAEPVLTTELYTRQCSLAVTARELAVMGETLADGGVNPLTGTRVVDAEV